jgi:hypothetical protein
MAKRFPMYFTNNKFGELTVPDWLTQTDFELLQQQVNGVLWVAREAFISEPRVAQAQQPDAAVDADAEGKE